MIVTVDELITVLTVEDIGVAGSEHVVDQADQLGEIEFEAILEGTPVEDGEHGEGCLSRLPTTLLLLLLILLFLVVILLV